LPDAKPRRTRIALAGSPAAGGAPSEASAHRSRAVEREIRERPPGRGAFLVISLETSFTRGLKTKSVAMVSGVDIADELLS